MRMAIMKVRRRRISKGKPTRFRFREIRGGRQRLGFRGKKVVEVKTEKKVK